MFDLFSIKRKHTFIYSELHYVYGKNISTVKISDSTASKKGSVLPYPILRSYCLHDTIHCYNEFFCFAGETAKEMYNELQERSKNI